MVPVIFWSITVVFLLISWRRDQVRTARALRTIIQSLKGLAPTILGMISLVGLLLALLPPEVLTKMFTIKGVAGIATISLVGAVFTMPAPIAFPLAGSLLTLGATPAALATFITTLTMVGMVSAPIEASIFGARFTLLRQVLSFAAAIVIGLLMGVSL